MSKQINDEFDVKNYNWKEVSVKKDKETLYIDSYQNFGWVFVNSTVPYPNALTVALKFKRDSSIRNKAEFDKLEKQFENGLRQIQKTERKNRNIIMIPALVSGIGGFILLALAIYNLISSNVLTGIILIFAVCVCFAISTFLGFRYSKIIKEKNAPKISEQYSKINAVCEEANTLATEIIRLHKDLEAALEAAEAANHNLEEKVEEKTQEVNMLHTKMLDTLATIIEYRSLESGLHIQRTMELTKILVGAMLKTQKFYNQLIELNFNSIVRAVPLHDVGKIGIPDNILLKPGKLTTEEFEVMKTHTSMGGDIIEKVSEDMNDEKQYLKHGRDIALHHHERWDGNGYGIGLKGEEIPLSARIVSVVDVYDALVNKRCYKESYSYDETIKIIKDGRGTQFDPDIVDVFLEVTDEFEKITNKLGDLSNK